MSIIRGIGPGRVAFAEGWREESCGGEGRGIGVLEIIRGVILFAVPRCSRCRKFS